MSFQTRLFARLGLLFIALVTLALIGYVSSLQVIEDKTFILPLGPEACISEKVFRSAYLWAKLYTLQPCKGGLFGRCRYVCAGYKCVAKFSGVSNTFLITGLLFILLALFIKYLSLPHLFTNVGHDWQSIYVTFCKWLADQIPLPTNTVRSLFNQQLCPDLGRPINNHTHPSSAMIRNASANFATDFAKKLGLNAFFYQKSSADVRNGRDGCRTYYWSKDLGVDVDTSIPTAADIRIIVDTDMYLDMQRIMAVDPGIYLISTFQPQSVAGIFGEYSYTFNESNEVKYVVSGGASFSHRVWNYKGDTILAYVNYQVLQVITAYNLDRRQISENHQLVLLTPIASFKSYFIDLTAYIPDRTLERLFVVDGEFLRLTVHGANGTLVSTGKPNSFQVATISAADDDTLSTLARISNTPLTTGQVRSTLGIDDMGTATMLVEYHRANGANHTQDYVCPVSESITRYQFSPKTFDPSVKLTLIPFMTPLMSPPCVPDQTLANDDAMVRGRIEDIKNKPLEMSKFLSQCIDEFNEFLIPEHLVHTGIPYDQDELYKHQARPTQRRELDLALTTTEHVSDAPNSTFMKKESYDEVKYPRNITTFSPKARANYAIYIYSFSDGVMKQQVWYAFGKTPLEIANRVAEICSDAYLVLLTDLSKMDGRVSNLNREAESRAMLRYFKIEFHADILEQMASQSNYRAYTTFGRKYESGDTRGSGSFETADFNSYDNGLMAYVGHRSTRSIKGGYLTPKEAWALLGIYGGDDGLTPNASIELHIEAAKSFGHVLEANVVTAGNLGVNFLSRNYSPEVWFGDNNSMCDVPRQLRKLHLTVALPASVTPLMKLGEKLLGYSSSDWNTPLIGDLCQAVKLKYPEIFPQRVGLGQLKGVAHYWGDADKSVQFPNLNAGDWMHDQILRDMPEFSYAVFASYLDGIRVGKDPLIAPMCEIMKTITKVPEDAIVSGTLVEKKVSEASGVCRSYLSPAGCKRANCKYKHVAKIDKPCKSGDKCKYKLNCLYKH